jgi:hypothetical protein
VRSRSASSNCICVRNRSMAALSKLGEIAPDFPQFVYSNPHNRDDPNDAANWHWREGHPNESSQRLEQRAKLREERGINDRQAPQI